MPAPVETARGIVLRSPTLADGPAMWGIADELPTLEANSAYSYLLVCRDFATYSVVAEHEGKVVGFVSAYRTFQAPEVVFVWQIGVAADYQSAGLGRAMLHQVLERPGCAGVRYMEATVTPSNLASQRLFRSFAERMGTRCEVGPCFPQDLFPGQSHEAEDLFRIGPF